MQKSEGRHYRRWFIDSSETIGASEESGRAFCCWKAIELKSRCWDCTRGVPGPSPRLPLRIVIHFLVRAFFSSSPSSSSPSYPLPSAGEHCVTSWLRICVTARHSIAPLRLTEGDFSFSFCHILEITGLPWCALWTYSHRLLLASHPNQQANSQITVNSFIHDLLSLHCSPPLLLVNEIKPSLFKLLLLALS